MPLMKGNETISSWIIKRRGLSKLEVEVIPISSIKNWNYNYKTIVHEKNSYFSIIGVEVNSKHDKKIDWDQPIIYQKEMGILGFIIKDNKILLQAKTEPGNVNGTHVAPSVQATVSNYMRVHNGDETKFLRYFLESDDNNYERISDSLQSEQGIRFMDKSNRNSIIRLRSGHYLEDNDDRFRWFEVKELLSLIDKEYLINTDTRSCLVSCNWEDLTENNIAFFTDSQDHGLKYWLNASYYQKDTSNRIFKRLKEIQNGKKYDFKIKDLNKLRNWRFKEDVIIDDNQVEFAVKGFKVSVADREISYWEQPLVHNLSLGRVVLYCQKRDGVLKLLLNAQIIIGLDEAFVWGPSIQITKEDENINFEGQTVLAECMQSDEGGRFYQSKCLYQIVELPERVKVPKSDMSYWASLAEIQSIVIQNKKTTNELRSVLSLLLKFL